MKSFLLSFICTMCILTGSGQDSTISLSRFETVISQPGRILKMVSREIGMAGWRMITKVKATDLSSGNSFEAVKIGYNDYNNFVDIINRTAIYIDTDELDSVISAFTRFIHESGGPRPANDLYYSYITPADVRIFGYCFKDSKSWWFGIEKVFQKLRFPVPGSQLLLNKNSITELLDLLVQAKAVTLL